MVPFNDLPADGQTKTRRLNFLLGMHRLNSGKAKRTVKPQITLAITRFFYRLTD